MRHSILFLVLLCQLFGAALFAQENPEQVKASVERIRSDTGLHSIRGKERVFGVVKPNKLGLEILVGLTKAHAMAIISQFENVTITSHEDYPFIKEVLEITRFKRWDFPISLYIFVDSSDRICRLNYAIGPDDGMAPEEAQTILEQLAKEHVQLNIPPSANWGLAGWDDGDRTYMYCWDKQISSAKPNYIVTLKSYRDDHLLPYLRSYHLSKDEFFNPVPEGMMGQ